jgi:hypothetical protein
MTSEYHLEKLTSFLKRIDNSCAPSILPSDFFPASFSFFSFLAAGFFS